ncbi:hypothetical protein PYCCODRAFT_1421484 [Trametes coccinea BRFM310]|uniref:Uncharacterized protein n=1 Tax=Trametes coccinea (strain BRFM310) TaxID=1353009 RepID=A0A1Y2J5L2_TRAC3|nr:hypothetical protein PYCCODRAFT_1421484 [Trametes coccinea BRFM310]
MSKKDKHHKSKDKKKAEKEARMPPRKLDASELTASRPDAQARASSGSADVPVPVPASDPEASVASTKHAREDDSDHEARASKSRRKKIAKVLAGMEAANMAQQSAKIHGLDNYHHQSRLLPRVISPFMNPFEVIEFGLSYNLDDAPCIDHIYSDSESDSEVNTDSEENPEAQERAQRNTARARTRELIFQYNGILDVIPDLKRDAKYFDQDELITLTDFVRARMNAARSDDSGRIRDLVITYMSCCVRGGDNREQV